MSILGDDSKSKRPEDIGADCQRRDRWRTARSFWPSRWSQMLNCFRQGLAALSPLSGGAADLWPGPLRHLSAAVGSGATARPPPDTAAVNSFIMTRITTINPMVLPQLEISPTTSGSGRPPAPAAPAPSRELAANW